MANGGRHAVATRSRPMEVTLSITFVERRGASHRRWQASWMAVKVSAGPSRRDAPPAGSRAVGQRELLASGLIRRVGTMGGPQAPLSHAAQLLGQLVLDVRGLVRRTPQGEVVLAEAGLDGESQFRAIRKYLDT